MSDFFKFIADIIYLLDRLVGVIIALGVLYFIFGLLKYVKTTSTEERKEAVGTITNGIIIIFVMVSVWGLVKVIANTFEIGTSGGGVSKTEIRVPIKY